MNKNIRNLINGLLLAFSATCGQIVHADNPLLGLTTGNLPDVFAPSVTGQGATYNGTTLSITSTPVFVTFPPGVPSSLTTPGILTVTADIDGTGALTTNAAARTFSITGSVTDLITGTPYSDPLLTGTITDYGIADLGANDRIEFRGAVTGGSMAGLYGTDDAGFIIILNSSTYSAFSSAWTAAAVTADVFPIPPVDTPTCDLALTKTVDPMTLGPFPPGNDSDSDSDSDSGRDTNFNNDSDDSDSDSGDDSVDSGSLPPTCGCKGKVDELVLQYNGTVEADIIVSGKKGDEILAIGSVQPGDQFMLIGNDKHDTLGTEITITVNGGDSIKIHTSCSEPIGPGLIVGEFEVISGGSRKLTVGLCPVNGGTVCPTGHEVTYTYTVTNNGSPVTSLEVQDDKLGLVGQAASLDTGASIMFTEMACIFETTTNVASATAVAGLTSCGSNQATATVEVLLPPDDCIGSDTDSDSGYDGNYSGDSDDSDSDSGTCDLDGDSDVPPQPTSYEGCSPGYWKQPHHIDSWVSFAPGDKYEEVFDVDAAGNKSLLKALKAKGGKSKALGRQAVAAILNAANPDVNYTYTIAQVLQIVQDAYTSYDFRTAKNTLESANKGCPLN